MRLRSCLIGAVVASLVTVNSAWAQEPGDDYGDESGTAERAAETAGTHSASISFAGDETITYRGVLVHVDYWLPLPDQWDPTGPALLELRFSHSPVLIERLSSMTASVNDNAIDSLFLNVQNARDGKVVWEIPVEYLRLGDSNKITITAKMRSDLELCDDVHSPALWITIQKDSRLVIRYAEKPVTLDVSKFPQSYLRPDVMYRKGKGEQTHAIILVPPTPTPEVLNAIGVVSARMGVETRFPRGRLQVRAVGDITDDTRSSLQGHNLIVVGHSDFVQKFTAVGLDIGDLASSGNGEGHLIESRNPWNAGRRALVITGADDQALSKAVTALSLPHLSEQWAAKNEEPPRRAVSFAARPEVPAPSATGSVKAVTVSMADLGASDRTERGKFHHYTRVAFPNPFVGRVDPNQDTFIRLFLSHSGLLLPQTSSLLVKINGEPVRSVRLSPRTARKLEADVIVPRKFLGERAIVVDLEFFLDIGDPDCHYNFPEMAWATLFNTSFIAYKLTDASTTSLRSYPYVASKEDNLNGLTFVVAEAPSDEDLSAVANVAAYLGKTLPRARDASGNPVPQWVHPWVKRVGSLTEADLKNNDLVVVGDYQLVQARSEIQKQIPDGLFADAAPPDKLQTYSGGQFRGESGWIHLASSPWNSARNVLVVSGARGAPAVSEASEYLWISRKVDQLGGTTVLVGPNGAMQVLIPAPGEEPQAAAREPLVPRVPIAEQLNSTEDTVPVNTKVTPADAAPSAGPPAPPSSSHSVAYLVFVVLGLLLVVLVVVRIRDALRGDAG